MVENDLNSADDILNEANNSSGEQVTAPEVQSSLSKVASNPKSRTIILGVVVVVFTVWIYRMISAPEPGALKPDTVPVPQSVIKPPANIDTSDSSSAKAPAMPELPKLVAPTPPSPPKMPDVAAVSAKTTDAAAALPKPDMPKPTLSLPTSKNNALDDKSAERAEAKRKSSIVLVAGAPSKTQAEVDAATDFKKRGDLAYILGKGKIIEAVLETALNTDFGGDVRALVSRDVYAEAGQNILIPKGSKIFGTYTTTVDGAYGRISVSWSRIDTLSGYTINLAGESIDNLGRKGVEGRVDNKYTERLSNAVLTSAFSIALAGVIDKIVPPPPTANTTAANTALATSISNTTTAIFTNTTSYPSPQQQMAAMCAQIPQLISDKTSATYTTVMASCTQYQNATTGTPAQNLQALMTAINGAATGLGQATTVAAAGSGSVSNQQQAAKQGFTDISTAVKDMIAQHEFKPSVTVNQGHAVKIYVNKDYVFPRNVVNNVRILQ